MSLQPRWLAARVTGFTHCPESEIRRFRQEEEKKGGGFEHCQDSNFQTFNAP